MHALALKALLQPVERQVVGVLAHDDVSQQARAGQPSVHRRGVGNRRYHDPAFLALARGRVFDARDLHVHE